jgi:hypothetical protein
MLSCCHKSIKCASDSYQANAHTNKKTDQATERNSAEIPEQRRLHQEKVLDALSLDGILASMTVEGNTDAQVF